MLTPYESDVQSDAMALWMKRYGWRRSKKGNLFRHRPDGAVVTIFRRADGQYGVAVCIDKAVTYDPHSYATEDEAREKY